MYLHLGNDAVVRKCDIVAIFDMDNTTISKQSRKFLTDAQHSGSVIDITDDSIHTRRIQVCPKESDRIAICFERTDKSRNHKIKDHGGDHGQGDSCKRPPAGSSVHPRGLIVVRIYRSDRAGQDQYLKG